MSHFHRSGDTLEEQEGTTHSTGSRLAGFSDRIARAFTNPDRGPDDQLELRGDPEDELLGDHPPDTTTARFPVGPFGYNRGAVDHYLAELERELAELRSERPAGMSITEEIERLGEQTASILVVAHDQAQETTRHAEEQAQETTRRAQEQADNCIADAASNAVAITAQAKQQLRELDNETDSVWQERRRLIEDARTTGTALITLAEEAIERFPEDDKPPTAAFAPVQGPVARPGAPVDQPADALQPLIETLQDPPRYGD
ncbi:MAG TPA: DivIVA domain-containing protein [Solirubrobacteraceae bacterium]|jgi:cell division septum initiation protein DivIVA